MGKGVTFGKNVSIRFPERVQIGRGVIFGDHIEINNGKDSILVIGDYAEIGSHSIININYKGRCYIGNRSKINKFNFVSCNNLIKIGDDVMTAAFCHILDANHGMKRTDIMRDQRKIFRETHIGNDVWIGSNCVILAGSHIGNGVVVAAGSVTHGVLDDYGIYAGNPCVKKKERQN